ncbi:MAG: hypothetical protein ACRC80_28595, partial [Waterburya sp.]
MSTKNYFSSREFNDDSSAYINYCNFGESGYDPKTQKTYRTLSPENYVNKWKGKVFDEDTDPNKLPKDPIRLSTYHASARAGAQRSILRDKLASSSTFNDLINSEESKSLFNLDKFGMEVEDDDGDKGMLYLQTKEQVQEFVKAVGMLTSKFIDRKIEDLRSEIQSDLQSQFEDKIYELEQTVQNQIKEFESKAPQLVSGNSQTQKFNYDWVTYATQIIESNKDVYGYISGLDTKEKQTEFVNLWQNSANDLFLELSKKNPDIKVSPALIQAYTQQSLNNLLIENGTFLTEALPQFDSNY